MAARQPFNGQPAATPHAVGNDRLPCIIRATRHKAATGREPAAERHLPDTDHYQYKLHRPGSGCASALHCVYVCQSTGPSESQFRFANAVYAATGWFEKNRAAKRSAATTRRFSWCCPVYASSATIPSQPAAQYCGQPLFSAGAWVRPVATGVNELHYGRAQIV